MKNYLPWIIIAVLLLLIIIGIFTRPEPVDSGGYVKEYEAQIQRKDREIDVLTRRIIQDSIKRVKDSLKTVVTLKAYTKEIVAYKSTVAKLKTNPIIVKVREETPEIDSLIQAYDSMDAKKDERIRQLESELSQSQKLAAQAEGHFKEVIAAHIEKTAIEKERGDHYQKEARKLRRTNKLLKVVAVTVGVAGVFLGSR